MKKITLDSILLIALATPFIMTYRISSGETPYWLFGLIFLGFVSYIIIDILIIKEKMYRKLKNGILWILIASIIGSAFYSAIVVRHQTHPIYMIHDMPLQQEIAIRFLLDGKNPYAVSYFGTFLEQWYYSDTEVNPALYHFVLLPFYILFAMPFYAFSNVFFGFFDARMPLLFLFFALLFFASILVKDQEKKRLFLVLLSFNPAMVGYTLEGRSDIFMYAFLFLGFFLLHKNKFMLSSIAVGLAFITKQSVWPIFPFYIAYLYYKKKNVKDVVKIFLPFTFVIIIVVGPFLLWDAKAFIESTISYLSGNSPNSYPVSGYGLGKLLSEFGIIKDSKAYYPFFIWQILFGLPALFFLVKYLKAKPSVYRLILSYGIFLFVFWYLSRYFNNSHLGYLSLVFITAYFWPEER